MLKGTAHQFTLAWLWEQYPDTLCIWRHQRPSEAFGSAFGALCLVNEGICGHADRPLLARAMRAGVKFGLDYAVSSPLIDDERLVHVTHDDIVADPIAAIGAAYERWALPFTGEHETRMRTWLSDPANASNRRGKFQYSLSGFDMTEEDINTEFADCTGRFLSGSVR